MKHYYNLVVCCYYGAFMYYSIPAVSAKEACSHFHQVYGSGTITKITKGSVVQ